MPLRGYFLWVGGVLLALLLVADAWLPKLPARATARTQPPLIRIHSDQKWPERVVYDTSAPMVRLAAAASAVDSGNSAQPEIANIAPNVREAFAELRATETRPLPADAKKPEAGLQRQHRMARKHAARPVRLAARRMPFGWFGPTIW
jgi:hypothetical protein